jgi:hypothetical protein
MKRDNEYFKMSEALDPCNSDKILVQIDFKSRNHANKVSTVIGNLLKVMCDSNVEIASAAYFARPGMLIRMKWLTDMNRVYKIVVLVFRMLEGDARELFEAPLGEMAEKFSNCLKWYPCEA